MDSKIIDYKNHATKHRRICLFCWTKEYDTGMILKASLYDKMISI